MRPLHKDNLKEYLTLVDFFFTTNTILSFHQRVLIQVEEWHASNNLCNNLIIL